MHFIQLNAPIDMKNAQGLTPLHLACHQAHLEMSTLLLEHCKYTYSIQKNKYRKTPKNRTSELFAVITLKFKPGVFTVE